MKEYVPYTYLIGWSKLNIWYYGSEYADVVKIANPKNLWKIYFTSSKSVSLMREFYGEPDIIQIRKTFSTREKCIEWERSVLVKMKVIHSNKWLNRRVNGGIHMTNEIRNKISKANKGKSHPHTLDTRKRMSEYKKQLYSNKENHPKFGSTISQSHKDAISQSNKTRIVSAETRNKMSKSSSNRIVSAETKDKMRLARLGKKFSRVPQQN